MHLCRHLSVRSVALAPLFYPHVRSRAVCLEIGLINHNGLRLYLFGRQAIHHPLKTTILSPHFQRL
ncbi:hypothetical protein B932_0690 [Gluconobacter oxydans H24]|nr:hypothetical protein B932_0690 [Gluconobacter oxydans H24]